MQLQNLIKNIKMQWQNAKQQNLVNKHQNATNLVNQNYKATAKLSQQTLNCNGKIQWQNLVNKH